ncbi:hypothetical protein [Thalassomonas sp. M1454]|uniref:hypothetical protein n=1 Tax=Thalassomonas sp. M1454 TaxID=2594477 RepID=UPI00117E55DE|nr:hypothetical protein [Thalassomonas sp. M1454]TRX57459.1 hypothetical protein FNN08_08165 [Thalassomonas sp. M1454]
MNKLAVLAVSILVFCGAMLWYLAATDLNGFIRSQAITQVSLITKQQVDVKQVTSALEQGDISLHQLTIKDINSSADALLIEQVAAKVDAATINQAAIIVNSVNFSNLRANIKFTADGDSNFKQLAQQIESQFAYIDSYTPEKFSAKKKTSSNKKPVTTMQVRNIKASNIVLSIDLQDVNGKQLSIEIPELSLAAIGNKEAIDAGFIGTNVTQALVNAIVSLAEIHYANAMENSSN